MKFLNVAISIVLALVALDTTLIFAVATNISDLRIANAGIMHELATMDQTVKQNVKRIEKLEGFHRD